jgi:hypothetical protein
MAATWIQVIQPGEDASVLAVRIGNGEANTERQIEHPQDPLRDGSQQPAQEGSIGEGPGEGEVDLGDHPEDAVRAPPI